LKRNVEIKARATDPRALHERAERLSGGPPTLLRQEDTFFRCPGGRLKLRVLSDNRAELIHYDRPDARGPSACRYTVCPIERPVLLREALAGSLGVRGSVRKVRRLYLVGNTRIHVDEVEGLGAFVELEVVLTSEQTVVEGERTARELMGELGIDPGDLVESAYIDLLESGGVRATPSANG
jgi:adenylate cyclase class IV